MVTTPDDTPVTTPVELTVAVPVLLLVHVPPDGVAVSEVDVPTHTVLLPVIDAEALTVTIL